MSDKKEQTTIPDGFEKIEQASQFHKLNVKSAIVGEFLRIEEIVSSYTGEFQTCWVVKELDTGTVGLLPEKAAMKQFRDMMQPGTIFWLYCSGTEKSRQGGQYYTYEFAIQKEKK